MDPRKQAPQPATEWWEIKIDALKDEIAEIEKIDPDFQDLRNQTSLLMILNKWFMLLTKLYDEKNVKSSFLLSEFKQIINDAKNLRVTESFQATYSAIRYIHKIYADICKDLFEKNEFEQIVEVFQSSISELNALIAKFKVLNPSSWRILESEIILVLRSNGVLFENIAKSLINEKKFVESSIFFGIAEEQFKTILFLAEQAQHAGFNHDAEEILQAHSHQILNQYNSAQSLTIHSFNLKDDSAEKIEYLKAAIKGMEMINFSPEFLNLKENSFLSPKVLGEYLAMARSDLTFVLMFQSDAYFKNGKLAEGLKLLEDLIDIKKKYPSEHVEKGDNSLTEFQEMLCEKLDEFADDLFAKKEYDAAIKTYQKQIDVLNTLVSQSSLFVKVVKLDQIRSLHARIATALPLLISQLKVDSNADFSKSDAMEKIKKDSPRLWKDLKSTEEKTTPPKKLQAPKKTIKPKTFLSEKNPDQKNNDVPRAETLRRRLKPK